METCPLYQADLKIGDLVRLCLGESHGESHFVVGYLKYSVRNHWLSPGNLGLILSQIDPYQNHNVREHLQGAKSRILGFSEGVLSLSVNKHASVGVLQSGSESPDQKERKDKVEQRNFPLTGVDIGDIVLLCDKDLQVAGHIHELGRNHLVLGYRFPEEALIWLRRYDLSKFRNYENLSSKLR